MQHPPDNGYYSRNRCRMVKKMGTVFEKNMNLHREIDWRTDNGRDERNVRQQRS